MKRINPNITKKIVSIALTAMGSAGVCVTGYLSAKAGIAVKDIALDKNKSKEEKRREIVKEVIPVGLSAGATISCIISSNVISSKTAQNIQMEMAAGYVLLQNAYNQYRRKNDVATDEQIIKEISAEKVKEIELVTGDEKYPWCDIYHDKPWYASESDVYWAEIKTKEIFRTFCRASLNDFYNVLRNERGCDIPHVPNEESLIWDMDVNLIEWSIDDITFGNLYDLTEDGKRLYTLDFFQLPYPESEIDGIVSGE